MDSLTQALLGASVAEYLGGKKYGNRAPLTGAILGTIPDLDVFVGPLLYADPIQAEMFHRSVTHSLFFAVVAAPVFGWLASRFVDGKNKDRTTWKKRTVIAFFCFLTHTLIDLFTGYGTQILWPFSMTWFATDNISIVDPLYTIPFLILFLAAITYSRENPQRKKLNTLALIVSTIYMARSFGIQAYANNIFTQSIAQQHPQASIVQTSPEFFTTFLWRGLAQDEEQRYFGWWSIFDSNREITRKTLPKDLPLLTPFMDDPQIADLLERRNYQVAISQEDGVTQISMIQFGIPAGWMDVDELQSMFTYDLVKADQDTEIVASRGGLPDNPLQKLWKRIRGE